jgi:hypothetical protein
MVTKRLHIAVTASVEVGARIATPVRRIARFQTLRFLPAAVAAITSASLENMETTPTETIH